MSSPGFIAYRSIMVRGSDAGGYARGAGPWSACVRRACTNGSAPTTRRVGPVLQRPFGALHRRQQQVVVEGRVPVRAAAGSGEEQRLGLVPAARSVRAWPTRLVNSARSG